MYLLFTVCTHSFFNLKRLRIYLKRSTSTWLQEEQLYFIILYRFPKFGCKYCHKSGLYRLDSKPFVHCDRYLWEVGHQLPNYVWELWGKCEKIGDNRTWWLYKPMYIRKQNVCCFFDMLAAFLLWLWFRIWTDPYLVLSASLPFRWLVIVSGSSVLQIISCRNAIALNTWNCFSIELLFS